MKTKVRSRSSDISSNSYNLAANNMVRKSIESKYDLIKPDGSSATAKLRYGRSESPHSSFSTSRSKSPGSFSKSLGRSKSPGAGISRRKWSPGQAALFRRKKIEGESTVDDSLEMMALSDNNHETDDDDSDYLAKSLDAIEKSDLKGKPKKRSGRRPSTPTSIEYPMYYRSKPEEDIPPSTAVRRPSGDFKPRRSRKAPQKSKSCGSYGSYGSTRSGNTTSSDSIGSHGRSRSISPSQRQSRYADKGRRKPRSQSRTKLNQKDLPIKIQQRLYAVTDPNISIKERVELELEFMKGSSGEKRIYLEFRNHFDRQEFFDLKAQEEQEKQDSIEANAVEESLKEAAFQRSVEKKRQKERQRKEEEKERERRTREEARLHSLETISSTMSDIKNAALEAATVSVARNQFEIKKYEDNRRKLVQDFRQKEGREMDDVTRTLKEAIIEQEDPEEKRMALPRSRRPSWK